MDVIALRQRWIDHAALTAEVFGRLVGGRPLDGLALDRVDGRWDLRGLVAPTPRASQPKQYRATGPVDLSFDFVTLEGTLEFKDVTLEDLDLSGASLVHLRLFNSTVVNCRFDKADCRDLRIWATDVRSSTFIGANLYDSNVGAFSDGRSNRFQDVDFSHADVKKLSCGVADFVDCDFSHAKVEKINFWQASLVRCKFAGALRSVIFDGRLHKHEDKQIPNPMEDIDMSDVTAFEDVDFRGVNFDRIQLPNDPNLVVIRSVDFADRALEAIAGRADVAARLVRIHLDDIRQYDQPTRANSFINLSRISRPDAADLLRELISKYAS